MTHFGSDLDQIIAIEALRRAAAAMESLHCLSIFPVAELFQNDFAVKVDRTPAGQPVSGRVNVDVGDARATKGITVLDDGTVIIDHHFNGYNNTLEVLVEAGIYVPPHAVEVADRTDNRASALDYRSGIALVRYLTPSQAWELAEAGLLTAPLTDEQISRFGLSEAVEKQKAVVENAVAAVKKFAANDKVVFATEQILGGSFVAYELGYEVFCSVTPHKNGGVTFAINAAPGKKLPDAVLAFGRELQEKYGSGVFVRPDGGMIVAGGPKNPDFSVPISVEELRDVVCTAK